MTTGQFQLESDVSTRVRMRPAQRLTTSATTAGMTSLLIGLGVRNWLTDDDKEFLDQLAPFHYISFLMHGTEYVHPEGIELFSAEQIESSLLSHGATTSAVFSQQHRMNRLHTQSSQVHTAYIGEFNGKALTFGIAGPDNVETCTCIGDQFAHLVQQLRLAYTEAVHTLPRLVPKLNVPSPALVINRCSGRIMAANDAACRLVEEDLHALVGAEFGALKTRLTPKLAAGKITAENLQCGDISLSVFSLAETPVNVENTITAVLPDFLHCLRRTSLSLQMTAHHLESIVQREPGHPESELVRIFDEEAAELDQTIRRFHLLAEYQHLDRQECNPADELRDVVNRIATKRPERRLSLYEHWKGPVQRTVPAHSLAALYETILQVHFGQTCRCSTTDITVRSEENGQLEIHLKTQAGTRTNTAAHRPEWLTYATALALLMNIRVSHIDSPTLETVLTFAGEVL